MGGTGMAVGAGVGALRGKGLGQGRELIFYNWKIAMILALSSAGVCLLYLTLTATRK